MALYQHVQELGLLLASTPDLVQPPAYLFRDAPVGFMLFAQRALAFSQPVDAQMRHQHGGEQRDYQQNTSRSRVRRHGSGRCGGDGSRIRLRGIRACIRSGGTLCRGNRGHQNAREIGNGRLQM